jgi:hypothetical protein
MSICEEDYFNMKRIIIKPISDVKAIGGRAGMGLPFRNLPWMIKAAVSPAKAKQAIRMESPNP